MLGEPTGARPRATGRGSFLPPGGRCWEGAQGLAPGFSDGPRVEGVAEVLPSLPSPPARSGQPGGPLSRGSGLWLAGLGGVGRPQSSAAPLPGSPLVCRMQGLPSPPWGRRCPAGQDGIQPLVSASTGTHSSLPRRAPSNSFKQRSPNHGPMQHSGHLGSTLTAVKLLPGGRAGDQGLWKQRPGFTTRHHLSGWMDSGREVVAPGERLLPKLLQTRP